MVSSASALAFPPTKLAGVEHWGKDATGVLPEFDLEVRSDNAGGNLTAAKVYGGIPVALVIADDDVDTVDFSNNELDIGGHIYKEGDGPLQLVTTDTLPTGLSLETDYWIHVVGAGTVQLATSRDNALNGVYVAFSDVGVGTHTVEDTADSKRLFWMQMYPLLGFANDGAITLTDVLGYMERIEHRPRIMAYGVSATIAAGAVDIDLYPIVDN